MLKHYVIAFIASGTAFLAVGIFVFSRGPRFRLNQTYACYSASIAIWSIFEALAISAHNPLDARLLWQISHIGVILIAVFFIHFTLVLCNKKRRARVIIPASYGIGLFHIILNSTPLFIKEAVLPRV